MTNYQSMSQLIRLYSVSLLVFVLLDFVCVFACLLSHCLLLLVLLLCLSMYVCLFASCSLVVWQTYKPQTTANNDWANKQTDNNWQLWHEIRQQNQANCTELISFWLTESSGLPVCLFVCMFAGLLACWLVCLFVCLLACLIACWLKQSPQKLKTGKRPILNVLFVCLFVCLFFGVCLRFGPCLQTSNQLTNKRTNNECKHAHRQWSKEASKQTSQLQASKLQTK